VLRLRVLAVKSIVPVIARRAIAELVLREAVIRNEKARVNGGTAGRDLDYRVAAFMARHAADQLERAEKER